jgi:hypothetical protein
MTNMRIILYIVGAVALVFVGLVGYLTYLTQKSRVAENPEETTFDETGPLVEGFAIVTKHHPKDLWGNGQNRYGFVDAQGKRITYVKYQRVENFSEERAYVYFEGNDRYKRCGFIDTTGREVIPLIYANAGTFKGGITIAEKADSKSSSVGFIDRDGREVVPFKYNRYNDGGEGYYAVGVGEMNQEKWGFTDLKGREVIDPQFDEPSRFYNGYATVGKINQARGLMQYGLIDSTGRVLIPFEYSSVGLPDPQTGLVEVYQSYQSHDGRWHRKRGKVNLQNEVVEPLADVPE